MEYDDYSVVVERLNKIKDTIIEINIRNDRVCKEVISNCDDIIRSINHIPYVCEKIIVSLN